MTKPFPILSACLLVLVSGTQSGCKQGSAVGPMAMPEMQVVAVVARRQAVSETLSLVGSIVANEMVEIKSETDGIVQEIQFEEGQRVEKGQQLLRLNEGKLAASVAEAGASFELSKANLDRAQQMSKDKLISRQEFDQIRSTFSMTEASLDLKQRQLRDARIYAPFSGVVGARNVSPGQVVTRNTTFTWVVDLDPVKVELNVPERFLGELKAGQNLEVSVAAYGHRKFKGTVFFISPYVEREMRTALVKAQIPNPDHQLKPGMFASLDLTLKIRESAVVIPEVALMRDGDQITVFVVDKERTVQLKPVKIGVHLPGVVEILSGLEGGEQVIVEGVQKVAPGAKVKLAPPEAAAAYVKT